MKDQSLRVLMVEDSEDYALLIIRELKKGGYDPVSERVETAAAMKKALKEKQWDIILCDYSLPKFNAPSALAVLKEANIDIPIIIVSGTIGAEKAVECMCLGAQDYIMKSNLSRLCQAIARELEETKVRDKRKKAEEKLLENERPYRFLTEKISDIIWIADMNLRTIYISPSIKNVLGFSQEERMRQKLDEQLTPHSLSLVLEALSRELAIEEQGNADPNRTLTIELEYYHKDGSTRWMELVISGLRNDQGILTSIHGVSRDISELKQLESQRGLR
jgi:PAS domain S-box-containing protein